MHNRRGHGFQSDLIRKLLAEHGLRGAGVDGEFVRSLTVDHHAAKDEIQGFAESNGSRILRRRHHSDVRAERFQHLETGFGFGKPVRIARIQPDVLFKLLPLFRVVFLQRPRLTSIQPIQGLLRVELDGPRHLLYSLFRPEFGHRELPKAEVGPGGPGIHPQGFRVQRVSSVKISLSVFDLTPLGHRLGRPRQPVEKDLGLLEFVS